MVESACSHERFMTAALCDTAVLNNKDLICFLNGVETMRDHNKRLPPDQL